MSVNITESLHFYDYLCQKIGSEKEVKIRRLTFLAVDTSHIQSLQISSGSQSEGLDLKGSDIDLMYIDPMFEVYESEREAVHGLKESERKAFQRQKGVLIMDTDDTQPCFTRLHLYAIYSKFGKPYRKKIDQHVLNKLFTNAYENNLDKNYFKMLEQHGSKFLLSNERYKQVYFNLFKSEGHLIFSNGKLHGPCISDDTDRYDYAICLKCDKWISQAVPWIDRPHSSWLSPDIISKITTSGILFVPIGLKGSQYENLEWRISFSVAEKFLIFSFNHTQLLCYALLKIVQKEIIEKSEDLKGLLCSYYLKTLVFWISDDSNPTVWRPDNIIQCFMACLQRLLYSVEYSTLLHYFISDYNFFELRLSAELEKKKKLIILLKHLYQQGIQCFSASETLHDYSRFSTEINKKININSRLVRSVLKILCSCGFSNIPSKIPNLLNILLHHPKTDLTHDIFNFCMSTAHQWVPQFPHIQQKQNNKQQYYRYKYDLSHLLIGLHSDAVAGLLMLASFFYVHENYSTSLDLVHYALSKYTDDKCEHVAVCAINGMINMSLMTPKQESAIDMMKNEKLLTILKASTITFPNFPFNSQILPQEIQKDFKRAQKSFHPLTFAYFLRFLCCYHLHDYSECLSAIKQLTLANLITIPSMKSSLNLGFKSSIFIGIATQMMGMTDIAKVFFHLVAYFDKDNFTSAATRLHELRMDR